jgi:3-deoxy-manno-octulosonate cytidylyltransferase (CMP-KDO synthetase)
LEVKTHLVIPARIGSTRFPGKPLVLIKGQALLKWVIDRVRKVPGVHQIIVATDDLKIAELCQKNSIQFAMTDSELPSGTDRVYQALIKQSQKPDSNDIVVNVQGDEPLIPEQWISKLIQTLKDHPEVEMATLAHPMDWSELENMNSVKVVVNQLNRALYFSRYPIPHSRLQNKSQSPLSLKHIGLYAFRFHALEKFCKLPPSGLELSESLEQLRALDAGFQIQVIPVEGAIQGVDVPEDIQKVERFL